MVEPAIRALAVLHRVRRVETDQARRALAEALAHEAALTERDAAIAREVQAARERPDVPDRDRFAAWLTRMRDERAGIAEFHHAAEARTAKARAALAARRLAETAVEEALDRAKAGVLAERDRRERDTLEDAARALRRARESPGA